MARDALADDHHGLMALEAISDDHLCLTARDALADDHHGLMDLVEKALKA